MQLAKRRTLTHAPLLQRLWAKVAATEYDMPARAAEQLVPPSLGNEQAERARIIHGAHVKDVAPESINLFHQIIGRAAVLRRKRYPGQPSSV